MRKPYHCKTKHIFCSVVFLVLYSFATLYKNHATYSLTNNWWHLRALVKTSRLLHKEILCTAIATRPDYRFWETEHPSITEHRPNMTYSLSSYPLFTSIKTHALYELNIYHLYWAPEVPSMWRAPAEMFKISRANTPSSTSFSIQSGLRNIGEMA